MNIRLHTDYSILNGASKIDEYLNTNEKVLGITDNNLYGAIEFYTKCIKNNIKPILGLEVNTYGIVYNSLFKIVVYAKNYNGYLNLVQISTKANSVTTNHIEISDLKKYSKDLIFLIGGKQSELYHSYKKNNFSNILNIYEKFISIFNENDIYYEFFSSDIDYYESLKDKVKNPILIDEVYFKSSKDFEKKAVLHAIKNKTYFSDEIKKVDPNEYQKTIEEYKEIFKIFGNELAQNLKNLVDSVDIKLDFGKIKFPVIESANKKLEKLCLEKIKKLNLDQKYTDRLYHELDTIYYIDFASYFLILYDIVKYARDNKFYVGLGRGSATGSLVSYLLDITTVDPIEYNLLFERFLTKDKSVIPDIDIDVDSEKRYEIIQYISQKYGSKNAFQIITMNTFKNKQAFLSVAKIFKLNEKDISLINSKLNDKISILDTLSDSRIKQKYLNDINIKKAMHLATQIKDLNRTKSIHAAAVVISDKNYSKEVPLDLDTTTNLYYSQYQMRDLEKFGFIKLDILGLKTLTILKEIIEDINKFENKKISLNEIPLDDKKVYEYLSSGNTYGIFQLESDGMTKIIKNIKVKNINDLAICLSLYRPGPLKNNVDKIIISNREKKIEFKNILDDILKDTFGVIIYQDQILQILQKMANFSALEANAIRKALSKKKTDVIKKYRIEFINNLQKNGYSVDYAKKLYDNIEKFGEYGFNKSHAYPYAMISYYISYFKFYFTKYFYKVILDYKDKIEVFKDMKYNKILIYPVNINKSQSKYSIYNDGVRLGFSLLKRINTLLAETIIKNRGEGYKNIIDFFEKNSIITNDNIKFVQDLIYVGAFNEIEEYNEKTLITNIKDMFEYAKSQRISVHSLFISNEKKLNIAKVPNFSLYDLRKREVDALGFNILYTNKKIYQNILEVLDVSSFNFFVPIETKNIILKSGKVIKGIINNKEVEFQIFDSDLIISKEIFEKELYLIKYVGKEIKYLCLLNDISKDKNMYLNIDTADQNINLGIKGRNKVFVNNVETNMRITIDEYNIKNIIQKYGKENIKIRRDR